MAAEGERNDGYQRQEEQRKRPRPPLRRLRSAAALFSLTRQVDEELVELGVGLRRQAAPEPGLELVAVQPPFKVVPAEELADGVPLPVADAQRAVARPVAEVVPMVIRC
jgi:hypothetical protein